MKYKIYKLIKNGEVIYIGRTIQSLERRLQMGYKYINKNEVTIELIEETNEVSRERYWIIEYLNNGSNLLNKRGGDGLNHKDYYTSDHYKKLKRKWRDDNRDIINNQKKDYYQRNKEKYSKYYKEYYLSKKQQKQII